MNTQYTIIKAGKNKDTVVGVQKTAQLAKMQMARITKKDIDNVYYICETDESFVKGMETTPGLAKIEFDRKAVEAEQTCDHVSCSIVDGKVVCDKCGAEVISLEEVTPLAVEAGNTPATTVETKKTGVKVFVRNLIQNNKNITKKEATELSEMQGYTAKQVKVAWSNLRAEARNA